MKLLVIESKIKSSSKKEHEYLKDIFKKELKIDLEVTYRQDKKLLKNVKVDKGSIVQRSITEYLHDEDYYDWVHVRLSSSEWRKLKLKSNLYGEHQKIKGISVTFGRWSNFTKYKRAHLVKHEFPKMTEHTLGMLHEIIHGLEGNMAVAHSYLYGYNKLYTKAQERVIKPKRYVRPSSLKKALKWVFTASQSYKKYKTVVAKLTPVKKSNLYKPKNFDLKELVSKKTYDKYQDRAWQFLDPRILKCLQYVRDFYGKPITVNNWHNGGKFQYRGFDEGGFRKHGYSQHNHGRGIDFVISGISSNQVRKDLKSGKLKPPYDIWVEDDVSWNHWDVRASDKKGVYIFKP